MTAIKLKLPAKVQKPQELTSLDVFGSLAQIAEELQNTFSVPMEST